MSVTEAVVRTARGEVRGKEEAGVHAFLGLPYAAPPFGPRRLRPPEPPAAWDGIRDATAYGATASTMCLQNVSGSSTRSGNGSSPTTNWLRFRCTDSARRSEKCVSSV